MQAIAVQNTPLKSRRRPKTRVWDFFDKSPKNASSERPLTSRRHIGKTSSLSTNRVGVNISQLVDGSDNSIAARYEYDAFGGEIVSDGPVVEENAFRFSTKYVDGETGLVYYGYRYYLSELGRWLSRDPIEEQGGLNLYGFVGNSGVNAVDVLGEYRWIDFKTTADEFTPGDIVKMRFIGDERTHNLKTLTSERSTNNNGAYTIPRLRIRFKCERCWGKCKLKEYGVDIEWEQRILINKNRHQSPIYRRIGINYELDHVRDFQQWAEYDGRRLAQEAEQEAFQTWAWTINGCEENVANIFTKKLYPSLNAAGEASGRKWDDTGIHNARHYTNSTNPQVINQALSNVPAKYLKPISSHLMSNTPERKLVFKDWAVYSIY